MKHHSEIHKTTKVGWLRAAVLGANDGIVSTSSLILGVAAAHSPHGSILSAGLAGLVAGAMSMAAGEYVSVSSQADVEKADFDIERGELKQDPTGEQLELTQIYVKRGLDHGLAKQVAEQLTRADALGAHARDELGISEYSTARPLTAACASAASFASGAILPLIVAAVFPTEMLCPAIAIFSVVFLAGLGSVTATVGGSSLLRSVLRVTFWGILAMAITFASGTIFGTVQK